MTEDFSQSISPTAVIRAILGSYPFSIGLFRELLQNSDDARATKQVFLLDRRAHGTSAIHNSRLNVVQGPALLAFNDAMITDDDWKALRNIHQSSKVADTSKIGKYGIGFRSCYHVTDVPHILSGSHLAIMDPSQELLENGGVKLDIQTEYQKDNDHLSDHLAAFDPFLPRSESGGTPFAGTVFRLPLRTSGSQLSDKPVSADEISDLLRSFAKEELDVSLLFLRNVTSIEIYEIGADGRKALIGSASVRRTPFEDFGQCNIRKAIIETSYLSESPGEREWRILRSSFASEEAIKALSLRVGGDHTKTLSKHKLSPTVELAVPLNAPNSTSIGRLFTYLPLPLQTEFPIHINALFALTQSRQNLRNGGEVGVVPGSDDDVLIKWNQLLFDTYIPQAWALLLQVLVKYSEIKNVFDAWPAPQAGVHSGDYVYWRDMPLRVVQHALGFPIWPVFGLDSPSYQTATCLLIAEESIEDNILRTLVRVGLLVMRPPQYLTQIITQYSNDVKLLSPESAHGKLQHFTSAIEGLDDVSAQTILVYLLSTSNCHYIVGLSLIKSVTGDRMALHSNENHILLDEAEEELFATYDRTAVSAKHLTTNIREVLVNNSLGVLSLTKLDPPRVVTYLDASPYASQSQEAATTDQIHWLNRFWDWVQRWTSDLTFCNRHYLVPTTRGFKRPTDVVFDPQGDNVIAELLELLGVPVVDPRLSRGASGVPKCLYPSSDIHALLRALPSPINTQFSEDQAKYLCDHLLRHLPSSCSRHSPISTDTYLCSQLRSLPIYPVIFSSPGGPSPKRRTSIATSPIVRGVNPSEIPIFPQTDSITYLNLHSISEDILQYLDAKHRSPLSVNEMHDLMLQHLLVQSLEMQVAFVGYLGSNFSRVPRGILDRLAGIKFVTAGDGTPRMPKELVDPQAPIATLFPRPSSSVPDTSSGVLSTLISHLRDLKLFITELSTEIVRDRVDCIAHGRCTDPENLSCTLINLIDNRNFDCRDLSHSARDLQWIPTTRGLRSPNQCRDSLSHSGKTYLFDEVLSMVKPNVRISSSLRRAFHWDGEVASDILSQQLVNILEGSRLHGSELHDKVYKVVEKLGLRCITPSQLSSLRVVLQGRSWVPTRTGTLATTPFALLGREDLPEIGFCSTEFDSHRHSKVRAFLKEMGCVERPSKDSILERLRSLSDSDCTKIIKSLISLLTWLPPLAPKERVNLFVPDRSGMLCQFTKVYYNDIGPRAALIDVGTNVIAHPDITPELASDLGLQRLGLMSIDSQSDEDMGEDLVTTIRNRLREYTDSQLLLEFFANAADAGATEFNILIDEYAAPSEALLSPRCSEFQCVPALVLHNNTVFSDEDFKGIRRTGIGGKTGRRDTIGQFGLGALTMFHITELAMIVSRDQVLFLNPCKAHLSLDRAAFQLPLSIARKLYGDHLAPLVGIFGFDPPQDNAVDYSYEGTIFRLPLRSSKQLQNAKPISEKTPSLDDLASRFKPVAAECLLFTSVTSIRCCKRNYPQHRDLWSITATHHDTCILKDNVSARTIAIVSPDSPKGQEWRILELHVNETQLPPFIDFLKEQYRLRLPPVVRLGACVSPTRVAPRHSLFSTLPLPIMLNLPVHISGSFILASDRRSVRLDEYENLETNYNRWLLTTIIPMLYLHFLEDRASSSDNAIYWPGNTELALRDTSDAVSRAITDAVYEMAAKSDASIFRSKFHPLSLPPHDAHLMKSNHPRVLSTILETIVPRDAVQLPSSVTRRLERVEDGHISLVTPKYIHRQMLDNTIQFYPSILEFSQLQELINFLIGTGTKGLSALDCLVGLPLLPLEDKKTVVKFDRPSDSCFYVAPPQAIKANLFEPHCLVDNRLDITKILESSTKLNVEKITDANVGRLLSKHVSPSQILEDADLRTESWIGKFWMVFPSLNVSETVVADYPLVQTSQIRRYVSLAHCQSSLTIVADFSYREWLSQCLTQMGFETISTVSLPVQLQAILEPDPALSSVDNLLSRLLDHPGDVSVPALFGSLDLQLRERFISWVSTGFQYQNASYFSRHRWYRTLPIWRSINNIFVSANEAVMLPEGVPLESITPFSPSTKAVSYDYILKKMGAEPSPSIIPLINIPTLVEGHLDGAYQELIRVLLRTTPNGTSIPIPNSRRVIQQSDTLYSSHDDLFLAAFGPHSERFIHPSFRQFESQLEQHGLKRQHDLNMDMFKNCAQAFQNPTGHDVRDRGAVIFRIFCEDLPLRVIVHQEYQFVALDSLRFIPHNTSPHPLGNVNVSQFVSRHIRFLTGVVSPNRLVRQEFQAIAWSQRAFYSTEPHQRVLMAYPSLGVPTAEEVVNHLTVLATDVAPVHHRNSVLLDHLKQTYKWLDDHAQDAEPFLRQCTEDGIPLFLNVHDPINTAEEWNWKRGDHILLDEYDRYDTGHLECPRDFLKAFRTLLAAAGAVAVRYGAGAENTDQQPTADGHITCLLTCLNEMRRSGVCTDVCFTSDPPDGKPVNAHRAHLAACSSYFRDMFSGAFQEAGNKYGAHPIRIQGSSSRCIECVLDYAYTGVVPELKRAEYKLALEILSLMHYWSMTHGQRDMQGIIVKLRMVDPFNLDDVRQTAQDTQSTELLNYCTTYETDNSRLLQQVREYSAGNPHH